MSKKNNDVYDIVIFGGGTAGCACAYTAAKLGLKVAIIEKQSYLGGAITSSLVIPAMKTSPNSINNEFFNNLYIELKELNGASTYGDNNKGWFNPELVKIVLDNMMESVNVNILFEVTNYKITKNLSSYNVTIYDNNSSSSKENLLSYIESKYIVDATGDAEICKRLNCEFLDDTDKVQPINLRFIMSNIDTKVFSDWLIKFDTNRDVTTSYYIDNNILLSTAYTWDNNDWALKPIFDKAIKEGIITNEDANYFQIFSVAGASGSIAFNCPRILDKTLSRSKAYIQGRKSILRIANFCKKYFSGFENAYISSIANSLGVRVSNRVKGKYIYTIDDLKSGKKFDNPVVISNYPVDIHSSEKNNSKLEKVNIEYQLPVESLIVNDNLYIAGRCLSADFESQAALRIIPSCFSMGEGLAKYLAKK